MVLSVHDGDGGQVNKEQLSRCDVAVILYDTTDPESFGIAAHIQVLKTI